MCMDDFLNQVLDKSKGQLKMNTAQQEQFEEMATKIFEEGALPKEALGFDDNTIEAIYAYGYRLYQAARYQDAGCIFQFLCSIEGADPRFYLGVGACLHRLEKYETAAFFYEVAAQLDTENPMPLYYASDCRIKEGSLAMAKSHLEQVMNLGKKHPAYAKVGERAEMLLGSIREEASKQELEFLKSKAEREKVFKEHEESVDLLLDTWKDYIENPWKE